MDKLNRPPRIHFANAQEAWDLKVKMELKYFVMRLLYQQRSGK